EKKTIEILKFVKAYDGIIGQRKMATFNDYKYLNFLYCNDTCRNFPYLYCSSPGYRNPNDCFSCICPSGKEGSSCELLPKTFKKECQTNDIWVNENEEKITFSSQNGYYCAVRFLTVSNARILIRFGEYNFTNFEYPCTPSYGIQIKYHKDKGESGLYICVNSTGKEIVLSDDDSLYVFARFNGTPFNIEVYYRRLNYVKTESLRISHKR
uniref:Astacin domain-containing protein n=1 Tax=Parastrongyloides trichosuri TaxID=131310 RepID=A0A0N5A6X0_PARTI